MFSPFICKGICSYVHCSTRTISLLHRRLGEGQKICKNLEAKLYLQFKESFVFFPKLIFVSTSDIIEKVAAKLSEN